MCWGAGQGACLVSWAKGKEVRSLGCPSSLAQGSFCVPLMVCFEITRFSQVKTGSLLSTLWLRKRLLVHSWGLGAERRATDTLRNSTGRRLPPRSRQCWAWQRSLWPLVEATVEKQSDSTFRLQISKGYFPAPQYLPSAPRIKRQQD